MVNVEQIATEDGSVTLRDAERGITFRSTHGARTESQHVFVEAALLASRGGRVRVLELGFGGAMNFCETALACREARLALEYVSVEAEPVAPEVLAHPDNALLGQARAALDRPAHPIGRGNIELMVVEGSFGAVELSGRFDALYHDPFGPSDAPDCWTEPIFEKYARLATDGAILATYSAATRVRRAMASAGFFVARRPGPGRKREVTIASRSTQALADFELVFEP